MAEGRPIAVTVIGDDRPGIVAAVSKALFDAGCNLEDVSSTILRGHFSMMLIVRAPEEIETTELEERLGKVGDELGLVMTVRPVSEAPLSVRPPTHMVSVYGADRPGIVYQVTTRLAELGVNITDMTSRVIGPDNAPVYALMLEVVADDEKALRESLRDVTSELNIDLSVRALEVDLL